MRRIILAFCLALCAQSAVADSPAATFDTTAALQALLAGGWRYEPDGSMPPACDQPPSEMGQIITFEFAMTGGRALWTSSDGEEMSLFGTVSKEGYTIAFLAPDLSGLTFYVDDGGMLWGARMSDFAYELGGNAFRKCSEPADRRRIDGSAEALRVFGGGASALPVRFVDTRFAKQGQDLCLEAEAQYLEIDMVGPLGFSLNRWNNLALAEKLAAGEAPEIVPDEIGTFALDSLVPTGLGWEASLTELIPPNGSRGDTQTVRLQLRGDTLTIPEWQRDYLRCFNGQETTGSP